MARRPIWFALGVSTIVSVVIGLAIHLGEAGRPRLLENWRYIWNYSLTIGIVMVVNFILFLPVGIWRVVQWKRQRQLPASES